MQLQHEVAPGSEEAGQLGGEGRVCVQRYYGVWRYVLLLLYCFIYVFQTACPTFYHPITPFAPAAPRDTSAQQTFTGVPHKLYMNRTYTHMTYSNVKLMSYET